MGASFEVHVPELLSGAGQLRGDADDLRSAGSDAAGAAARASGACGGGPRAGAPGGFSRRLQEQSSGLAAAVSVAAANLESNAQRYTGADTGAAAGLSGTVGAAGSAP